MKSYLLKLEEVEEAAESPPGPPLRELWIAPGNATMKRPGTGSAADPLRVTTPQHFDDVFKDVHTGAALPTVFRLMPGTYYTQGCWAHPGFATLWAGDALIGSTDVVIRLADPVTETKGVQRSDIHVLSAGSPYQGGEFCRVESVTLDGCFGDLRPKGLFVTSGLRCYGTGTRVSDVEVSDIGGSYAPVQTPSGLIPLEAFGISFENGGGRVRDCVVRAWSGSNLYVSAFSGAPDSLDGVVFEDCVAYGRDEHAAFTVYSGTVLRNCRARGFAYGIYNDTGHALGVDVLGGVFDCNRVGVGVVGVEVGSKKASIRVQGARFRFMGVDGVVGLELIAKPQWNGVFRDIELSDCLIELDKAQVFTVVSTDAAREQLEGVRVCRSRFPAPARVNAPANHRIELISNTDLRGIYFLSKVGLGSVDHEIVGADK